MRFIASSIVLCTLGLALTGCNQVRAEDRVCGPDAWSYPKPEHKGFASGYFAADFTQETLDCGGRRQPVISKVERDWFPEQWEAACEPSVYAMSQAPVRTEFAIRFSLIPSFEPSVFITVQSEGQKYKLIARELSGAGGYDPGYLARSKEEILTTAQVSELKQFLKSATLFQEPAARCDAGFDGEEWIFELVDKGSYRMVKRWSPDAGTAHDLGALLIRLSGWKFDAYQSQS